MAINQTILNDFVRATVSKPSKDQESIVYGTVVIQGNKEYVKLDGSELLTPIDKTVGVNDGDRTRVSIKNHSATIVGNNTDPSAKGSDTASALNSIDQINSVLYQEDGTLIQVRSKFEQYDSKFEQYDSTFEQYNSTFEQYDSKFEQYDSEFEQYDSTFEQYDSKFEQVDSVLTQHNSKFEQQDAKFTQYDSNFTQINSNFISVNSNLTTLNSDVTIINSAFKIEDGVVTGLKGAVLEWLQTEYADIGFANIGEAAIEKLYADTGLIENLHIDDGHISGELAAVTINADTISAGSLDAKRLRILGEDGLYYILNVNSLGETTAKADPKYKSGLDGTAIIAKSLTADKVYVTDLSAFNAAIGGINITGSSIYSKTKASVENTNPGFYLDDEGQFALGNATEYLKFYKDSSNTWKLDIQASAINTKISDAISTISLSSYRNYIIGSDVEYNFSRSTSNNVINYVLNTSTAEPVRKFSDAIFEAPFDKFVISFYARCSSGSSGLKIDSYLKDSGGNVITTPDDHYTLTTSYKRYVIPVSLKSGKTINDISVFTIRLVEGSGTACIKKVKLESGNEASEWSQAPEDITDRFVATEHLISQTADSVTDTLTSKINGLQVGGRNLLPLSTSYRTEKGAGTSRGITVSKPDKDGWFTVTGTTSATTGSIGSLTLWASASINLPASERVYTVETIGNPFAVNSSGNKATNTSQIRVIEDTNESTRLGGYTGLKKSSTRSVTSVDYYIGSDTPQGIVVNGKFRIKIEDGNMSTTWTPAPEDVDHNYEVVTNELKRTADSLSSTITKVAGNVRTGSRNLTLNSKSTNVIRKNTTNDYISEKLPFLRNSEIVVGTLNTEDDYTVSFDYEIKGLTTACAPKISLNYTDSAYQVGNFSPLPTLAVGKTNTGHYTCTAKLTSGQAQHGTKWLLGGFGAGQNANADITITNFQFEFGGRATTWTPAPEDTEDKITVIQSYIDQTPEMIALGVKSIKIGGRNLIEGTAGDSRGVISFTAAFKDFALTDYAKRLPAETEMIVSFQACASKTRYIDCYWNDGSTSTGADNTTEAFKLTTSYQTFSYVITNNPTLSGQKYFRVRQSASAHGSGTADGTIYIKNLKLEVGNKATTWDMAPEEMATSAQLKITDKSIESCVKNGSVISSINQTSESIRIKAEKIDLQGIATFTNSGGRNLLKNSSFAVDYQGWTKSGAAPVQYTYTQRSCHRYSGESGVTKYLKQNIFDKIKAYSADQVYTLSAEIRVTTPFTSGDNAFVGLYTAGDYSKGAHDSTSGTSTWCGPTVISGDSPKDGQWTRLNTNSNNLAQFAGKGWKKVYIVFKIPHAATDSTDWLLDYYVYVYARDFTGNFYFRNLKLELGEWPNDWAPASDDHMDVLDYCTAGTTTINGGMITTGSITADKIDVNDLFAKNITATGRINFSNDRYSLIGNDKGVTLSSSPYYADGSVTISSQAGGIELDAHASYISFSVPYAEMSMAYTATQEKGYEYYISAIRNDSNVSLAGKYYSDYNVNWWYKKHNDGTVEMWGRRGISEKAASTDIATGFTWGVTAELAFSNYPVALKKIINVQKNYSPGAAGVGGMIWNYDPPTLTNPGSVKIVAGKGQSLSGYIDVYVVGRWKE